MSANGRGFRGQGGYSRFTLALAQKLMLTLAAKLAQVQITFSCTVYTRTVTHFLVCLL